MRMNPSTSMAAVPGTDFSGLANLMAMKGRGGDNTLVHMSKSELPYLNMLAKSAGYPQGLPVNPKTGLPEANILKTILPVAGAILGGMFFPPSLLGLGAGSALATGIGAGLGSFGGSLLAGKSLKDAAIGGLISGGLSGLGAATFGGQSFMGDTTSFAGDTAAAEIAKSNAAAIAGNQGAAGFADVGGMAPPLTTSANTNMFTLGAGDQLIPIGSRAPIDLTAGLSRSLPTSSFESSLQIDPNIAGELSSPFVPATGVSRSVQSVQGLGDIGGGAGFATPAQAPVPTTQQIADAYVERGFFDKGFGPGDLREGYTPSAADLQAIKDAPSSSYFSFPKTYDPAGPLTRMDFLRTQLKPATTMGLAGVAVDAIREEGAFEPIKYNFPEEPESTPFSPSNIRFASRRTGAFPRTEEEALAFAQPGGTRQRFFDQSFFTPAKTGGGLATLEVKKFEDGGPSGGEDAGDDDGGVAGDAESAAAGAPGPGTGTGDDSGEDFGGEFGGFGDEFGGLGAVSGVAGAADAAAAAAADAALEEQTLTVPTPRSTEEDIEEDLFDVEMGLPSPVAPTPDVADMDDFGPFGRSDIAATLGGRSVNPGFSFFGYQTGIGRGPFGGYTSTDPVTAQTDVDKGYATAPVGSFSVPGFLGGVAKTAASVAVPGVGLGISALQEATTPPGTGTLGALANMADPQGAFGTDNTTASTTAPASTAPASTSDPFGIGFSDFGNRDPLVEFIEEQREEEPTVEMAKGGDILSFFSPAFGLGRAAKKGGIEGALSFLSPAFALSQGQLPGPLNNLMSAQSGKAEQQAPVVRAAEAPTEQIALPPTKEELEEARDVAVLQQVLSGVPVEAQAGGLISAYQMGGPPSPYFEGMVKGRGDGMSDSIPFTIEGTQPAILSRDEYVLPADIVSMMGNGSSDAGAEKIDAFINDFRVQKYGRGKQPPETRRGLSSVA